MGHFVTGSIAVGKKKHGLEELRRWVQAGWDQWQQSTGEAKQKKGQ